MVFSTRSLVGVWLGDEFGTNEVVCNRHNKGKKEIFLCVTRPLFLTDLFETLYYSTYKQEKNWKKKAVKFSSFFHYSLLLLLYRVAKRIARDTL